MVVTKSAILLLFFSTSACSAWLSIPTKQKATVSFIRSEPSRLQQNGNRALFSSMEFESGVQVVSLEVLTNHEEEGSLLAVSLIKWLDAEWMPQDIHVTMGESAKKSYIEARENGESDIMSVMIRVADDLRANWKVYEKEAFVNEWDVANYCSDYFTQRSGNEACDCSTMIL